MSVAGAIHVATTAALYAEIQQRNDLIEKQERERRERERELVRRQRERERERDCEIRER